jgi:DNA-binding XRE family transcriptional regulator
LKTGEAVKNEASKGLTFYLFYDIIRKDLESCRGLYLRGEGGSLPGFGEKTERLAKGRYNLMGEDRDLIDEIIAERTKSRPNFSDTVEAAEEEHQLMRKLAAKRNELGLTQTEVAHRMKTSQSAVARLERGEADPQLSTLKRFAEALGLKIAWNLENI